MPKESNQIGDLWRYVQPRKVAADEARAREWEARERSERENREARERSERERQERVLQLFDAPRAFRNELVRFKVRELLEEVRHDFAGWSGTTIAPVRPDEKNQERWGYTLNKWIPPFHIPDSPNRPNYDNSGVQMHWSVGAGTYFTGQSRKLHPDIPGYFEREIRIVTAGNKFYEDGYDTGGGGWEWSDRSLRDSVKGRSYASVWLGSEDLRQKVGDFLACERDMERPLFRILIQKPQSW